jgi:hypothetical protein
MGKEKQMKSRARALRVREQRVARSLGMLADAETVLKAKYDEGFEAGHLEGLVQAEQMAKSHRRMTDFLRALRALIGTGAEEAS